LCFPKHTLVLPVQRQFGKECGLSKWQAAQGRKRRIRGQKNTLMKKSKFKPGYCVAFWFGCLVFCALQAPVNAQTKPRPPFPPWPEQTLIILGFDEPLIDAEATRLGALVENTVWAPSWSGYALNRQGATVKPVKLPMAANDKWFIGPEQGAIRFWFRPDWSSESGPGEYARLIELTTEHGKDSLVWWSLYVSPDGRTLYLSAQGPEQPVDCIKTDINWHCDQWHLIALSYSPKETFLHLDGELAGIGPGLPSVPAVLAGHTTLSIGSDSSGRGVAYGQFDELCTFPSPLAHERWEGSLYPYYNAYRDVAAKGPVTEADEAANRQAALEYEALGEAEALDGTNDGEGGAQLNIEPGLLYLLRPIIAGTNVHLTLWGGQTNQSYNILYTPVLPANNWVTIAIGSMGQTNFIVPMLGDTAFYRAEIGNDWDGDGIPNWIDAQPSNPNIGALRVTIDWPLNGTQVQ